MIFATSSTGSSLKLSTSPSAGKTKCVKWSFFCLHVKNLTLICRKKILGKLQIITEKNISIESISINVRVSYSTDSFGPEWTEVFRSIIYHVWRTFYNKAYTWAVRARKRRYFVLWNSLAGNRPWYPSLFFAFLHNILHAGYSMRLCTCICYFYEKREKRLWYYQ